MKKIYTVLCIVLLLLNMQPKLYASNSSTAGFYKLEGSNREVYSMNIGWRFYKGDLANAHKPTFNDSQWTKISLPHGLELLPEEASGGVNYQGVAWYRKNISVDRSMEGKKIFLHFEGIMGKSKIWINGIFVKEHFGGFLPIVIDATDQVKHGEKNLIAICADNSDDSLYPPGKPQSSLDFSYFGGIYRDSWLVVHNKLHITDPNYENEQAGGGLFVHYSKVSDELATASLKLHLRNDYKTSAKGFVSFKIKDRDGNVVSQSEKPYAIKKSEAKYVETVMNILQPKLWMLDSPYLYDLEILVVDATGEVVDGYSQRIGIRSIDFRGKDGLWLNGKQFNDKLIGVNRHQDFAIIGNALPNSLHWRDVKKLRDAGVRVIRSAHYPQDPAFMDACDELGIFVIVATPGWQFWNNDPIFGSRIYSDIRNMVRRDRNHPSVFFWEPVLNETSFPLDFALNAKKCVEEEYPYKGGNNTACDPGSKGSEYYPINYSHPFVDDGSNKSVYSASKADPNKVYFTREFGDNVDDWAAHNSTSRVHRSWGEQAMLVQANHYAHPDYPFTCLETLYAAPNYHIGGTLWHSFDHQRGYHPQTFYGGIMDSYRQEKTSYQLFKAQRPPLKNDNLNAETGAMIYIAHEMTPFSSKDVTVFSNCDEVRLTVFEGEKQHIYKRSSNDKKMPSPIITFNNVYDFMALKALSRTGKHKQIYILAEGLIDGKVVATEKKVPSYRPKKLRLRVDDDGLQLKADGSDIVTVIAEIVDNEGTVKRLNNYMVKFTVEGQGKILTNPLIGNNPTKSQWGSAPMLIQSTHQEGEIKIKAEILGHGIYAIEGCELTIRSVKPKMQFLYNNTELPLLIDEQERTATSSEKNEVKSLQNEVNDLKKKISDLQLKEVEKQQDLFGEPF